MDVPALRTHSASWAFEIEGFGRRRRRQAFEARANALVEGNVNRTRSALAPCIVQEDWRLSTIAVGELSRLMLLSDRRRPASGSPSLVSCGYPCGAAEAGARFDRSWAGGFDCRRICRPWRRLGAPTFPHRRQQRCRARSGRTSLEPSDAESVRLRPAGPAGDGTTKLRRRLRPESPSQRRRMGRGRCRLRGRSRQAVGPVREANGSQRPYQ
jgi:hypothetical protein